MQTKSDSFVFPTIAGAVIAMIIAGMMDMHASEIIFAALVGALAMQVWKLRQHVNDLSETVDDIATIAQSTRRLQEQQPAPLVKSHATAERADTPSTIADQDVKSEPRRIDEIQDAPIESASTAKTHPQSSPIAPRHVPNTTAPMVKRYAPPPPSAFELQMQSFWKWLTTRNPIALAAVAISFLGGVFLVKYAAEHSHFPIEYRFMALSAVTIAAVVTGWRIHTKNNQHKVFAQVLQGGGIAGLYLTVFAATRLYQLLPPQLAFILMACIAFASAILAVAQSALPLAIIGTVGGFLTPMLVSTGGGSHVALFTYYALLNAGVFTVAWFRTWRVLNVISFAFTFSITALWRGNAYRPEDWWSADLFLLLFFLMFVAISILNALRQPPNLKGYVSGSLVFGLPVAAFSLHASLVQTFPYVLAYSALGVALFYCSLAVILNRQSNTNFRLLIEAFAALAVIFASLAIPLAFNRHVTAAMWSFEGAGMIWLGLRTQRKLPRFFGMLLQVSAGISYLHMLMFPPYSTSPLMPILNGEYLGSLLLCGTAWFSAWLLHVHQRDHEDQPLASYEGHWATIALCVGCGWWLFGGLHEIAERFDHLRVAAVLIHAALGSIILWSASRRWTWRLPAVIAIFTPAAGACVAMLWLRQSLQYWHPFEKWGIIGWPILFASQYLLLFLSDRTNDDSDAPPAFIKQLLHTASFLALTVLLTWEAHWQVASLLNGIWSTLILGLIPGIMLWSVYTTRSREMWPVSLHPVSYRIHAGVILAAYVLLWALLVNLGSDGNPMVIAYIPLLNPLDISTLLLLAVVIKWWNHLSEKKQAALWPFGFKPVIAIAALVFIWMNAAVIRTLHYYFDVPLDNGAWFQSSLLQTTLSIFWMLLALIAMVYASKKLKRPLWITGAVLMAVVIGKLLLIDLSSISTLARIISFLSVGALLFVVSYISPLPPGSETEVSAE